MRRRVDFLQSDNFEKFAVYNFSIDYPKVCRIEFNPKSRHDKGDIVFHFPDREKIYISWGELKIAKERFQTVQAHADEGFKRMMKGRGVSEKDSQRVAQNSLRVNNHEAVYNNVKLGERMPGLFMPRKGVLMRQTHSVHLFCDESSRYFVIYTLLSPKGPDDFGDLLLQMAHSFKCH